MLSDRIVGNYSARVFSAFFPKNGSKNTLKLFLELRFWDLMCVPSSHRDTHRLCLRCAICLPMTGVLQRCLCVCFLLGVWLNSPSRDSSSSSGRKEKITSPSILVFDRAFPFYLGVICPLCSVYPGLYFTRYSSGPPRLWCREVICPYVRAVLSPAYPIWLL